MRYLARRRVELRRACWLRPHQVVVRHETRRQGGARPFVPQRYHIVWVVDPEGRLIGHRHESGLIEPSFSGASRRPMGASCVPLRAEQRIHGPAEAEGRVQKAGSRLSSAFGIDRGDAI